MVLSSTLFFLLFLGFSIMISSKVVSLGVFPMEWDLLNLELMVDQSVLIFLILLLIVFLMILFFSCYYMHGETFFIFYLWTMLVFVSSMVLLLLSKKLFLVFVGWDLLGISSFLLVNFYLTWDSVNSALNTVMSNRVGDFFLFLTLMSWIQVSSMSDSQVLLFSFMGLSLLLTAFTKSAQFPFSGWLPKAMAAPTPVSALVHSSTLVTAGLLLLLKFGESLLNQTSLYILFWVGLLTLVIASFSAFVEEDVKKVVALSTLSQMGLATTTMGFGFLNLSFLHLVSHGFFKSLLFIQVGFLMHQSFSQQDPRDFLYGGRVTIFTQLQLIVSLFSLCGLFYTNGLVTKDLVLEVYWGTMSGILVIIVFFFSILLTFFYSFRLWKALFMSTPGTVSMLQTSVLFHFLSLVLVLTSIFFMWWVNLNLLTLPFFFIYVDFYSPLVYMTLFFSIMKYCFNLKNSFMTSKFLVDYFLLISRWSLIDLKKLDVMGYKMDFSFITGFQYLSLIMTNLIQSKLSWVFFMLLVIFMFW